MLVNPDNSAQSPEKDLTLKVGGLKKCFGGDLAVGAGKVFAEHTVRLIKGVGGDFIATPDINRNVIERAVNLGMVALPSAYTANEISSAFAFGADYTVIFPTKCYGSTEYAAYMASEFGGDRIFTSSEIELSDIPALKKAGINRFLTRNIANVVLAQKGAYDVMTKVAEKYVNIICK